MRNETATSGVSPVVDKSGGPNNADVSQGLEGRPFLAQASELIGQVGREISFLVDYLSGL